MECKSFTTHMLLVLLCFVFCTEKAGDKGKENKEEGIVNIFCNLCKQAGDYEKNKGVIVTCETFMEHSQETCPSDVNNTSKKNCKDICLYNRSIPVCAQCFNQKKQEHPAAFQKKGNFLLGCSCYESMRSHCYVGGNENSFVPIDQPVLHGVQCSSPSCKNEAIRLNKKEKGICKMCSTVGTQHDNVQRLMDLERIRPKVEEVALLDVDKNSSDYSQVGITDGGIRVSCEGRCGETVMAGSSNARVLCSKCEERRKSVLQEIVSSKGDKNRRNNDMQWYLQACGVQLARMGIKIGLNKLVDEKFGTRWQESCAIPNTSIQLLSNTIDLMRNNELVCKR